MYYLKAEDLLLFPLYTAAFYYFIRHSKKKLSSPLLEVYFLRGFWIKILGTIAFTIFNTYVSPGDSITVFFPEGVNLYHAILKDPSMLEKVFFKAAPNIDINLINDLGNGTILNSEANFMLVRVTTIFAFLSGGSYFVTNLFFSMLSFAGMWRLFKFFYSLYPSLHKEIAIATLYFPSVIFWSSGVFKDPLCLAGIGFITYSLYKIVFTREAIIGNILLLVFFGFLMINIKIYIILSYLPCLLMFIIIRNIVLIKNLFVRAIIGPAILLLALLFIYLSIDNFKEDLGVFAADDLVENIKKQQSNFESQSEYSTSNFNLGVEFDGSINSLIKAVPFAITATLFRPFIWESNKISTLLSSIESLFLMLFTLYVLFKVGPFRFFITIGRNVTILYAFSFAMLFGIFIGASTLNFGSLVRYKIPCLPFYLISLFLILDIGRSKSVKKIKR